MHEKPGSVIEMRMVGAVPPWAVGGLAL